VRSVTDTSGHIQFLGWHPTLGELVINIIWPLVIALLVALLIEPLQRWLSQLWSLLSDRIASLSDNRKAKRINALELKIKNLKEYDDRKLLILFARRIVTLIVVFGFLLFISILAARIDLVSNGFLAAKVFDFGTTLTLSSTIGEFIYGMIHGALTVLLILTVTSASITFQDMSDFSDPPKAIRRLEKRIFALNTLRVKRMLS
jgi:hypothetical protein